MEISDMETVAQLRAKLKRAEQRELDENWTKAVNRLKQFAESLKGKDVIHYSSEKTFHIFRMHEYEECYYADSSGFYGQWDKRRWISIPASGYRVSDVVKLANEVTTGIPLRARQSFRKEYDRFINLGCIEPNCTPLIIGEEAYKARDYSAIDKALSNFAMFTYLAPEGLYDKIEEIYKKSVDDILKLRIWMGGLPKLDRVEPYKD